MPLGFKISEIKGSFVQAATETQKRIAVAATLAIRDAAATAKREGRVNIASAGFSSKWQSALQYQVFPKGNRSSIDAAALVFHKIPYSGIFETGGTIVGNPRLWLPTANVPVRSGGRRMQPSDYVKLIGPLRSVSRTDGVPMLVGRVPRLAERKPFAKNSRKTFATRKASLVWIPMFVGIDSVTEKKRFDLVAIIRRAASRLGEYYLRHIQTD